MSAPAPINRGQAEIVPLSAIIVRPEFNARTTYREIESLAASIEENGLEVAVQIKSFLSHDEAMFSALAVDEVKRIAEHGWPTPTVEVCLPGTGKIDPTDDEITDAIETGTIVRVTSDEVRTAAQRELDKIEVAS